MRFLILGLIVVFMSCESSKKILTAKEIEDFKKEISHKKIEVTSNFAQAFGLNSGVRGMQNLLPPGSTIGNINLSDNPNFFIFKKDSLKMDLPYYGQQQMSTDYGGSGGVKFSGKVISVTKKFNEKKKSYILSYLVKAKRESYNIILTLYPNKSTNLVVNSSHRTSITYLGNWKVWEKEKS